MILDGHIHIGKKMDEKREFMQNLEKAGVDGGIVLSYSPPVFEGRRPGRDDAARRIAQVMDYTAGHDTLFPFFFIDPTEADATDQVDQAVGAGIRGFKVICGHHYPQDERAMPVYAKIASLNKPILFHSGILYSRSPSGEYNRPCNYEYLFTIDKLRFALAHVSWPWCDELIAVFGKWNHFYAGGRPDGYTSKMYVDLTPGTPSIYREETLTKLIRVGYENLPDQMIFGSDCTSAYSSAYAAGIIAGDNSIYDKLGVAREARDKIFGENLLSFIEG